MGVEVEGLHFRVPPQHPQHLLLQHGVYLRPTWQLVKSLGVLTDVEALDLLVGAVHFLQSGLAGDSGTARARARRQAITLQVKSQAAQVDVVAMAVGAFVGTLTGVQALVELEVDELGELCRA